MVGLFEVPDPAVEAAVPGRAAAEAAAEVAAAGPSCDLNKSTSVVQATVSACRHATGTAHDTRGVTWQRPNVLLFTSLITTPAAENGLSPEHTGSSRCFDRSVPHCGREANRCPNLRGGGARNAVLSGISPSGGGRDALAEETVSLPGSYQGHCTGLRSCWLQLSARAEWLRTEHRLSRQDIAAIRSELLPGV